MCVHPLVLVAVALVAVGCADGGSTTAPSPIGVGTTTVPSTEVSSSVGTGPEVHVVPRPFEVSDAPVVKGGEATRGATSNYIRFRIEEWAPGELPD